MGRKLPKSQPINAPAVVRTWRRILAVGCSHGIHADRDALNAVVRFREQFKPHECLHLGDFMDTAAFRSGAKGTSDESAPIAPDVERGLDFLDRLRPTRVMCGNHEDRLWRFQESNNAIVAHCAGAVVDEIEDTCAQLGATLHPYSGVWQGITIGGVRYMHGVMCGENATRDHAEAFGNVVHAHTHRTGMAKARRSDNATGWCVGTLTRPSMMDYAKTRRATLAWSRGFVWGEFCDAQSVLWLHEQPDGVAWRLPH